jgi:MoaA/NifB/PqqE/SkfB family radical SAM enzyme
VALWKENWEKPRTNPKSKIGGEPTLEPYLPDLIALAHSKGFEFVEVYTIALSISDSLIECFRDYGVHIATSFYSSDALVHETVTTLKGSQAATSKTIAKLVASGIAVRASLIVMEHNQHTVDATVSYLHTLGVSDIGFDNVRGLGRGRKQTALPPKHQAPHCRSSAGTVGKAAFVLHITETYTLASCLNVCCLDL